MSRKNYQSGTSLPEHRLPSIYDREDEKLRKKRQQRKNYSVGTSLPNWDIMDQEIPDQGIPFVCDNDGDEMIHMKRQLRKNCYQFGTSRPEHRLPSVYDGELRKKRQQRKSLKVPVFHPLQPLQDPDLFPPSDESLGIGDYAPYSPIELYDPMEIDYPMDVEITDIPTSAFLDPITPPKYYGEHESHSGWDSF